MKNIHFKTCTCLLGILLILFSGIQVKGASLEVQQESKVSGTVTDEKGEPVIGASVVVVESKQGTITDIDGKFLVNVPKNGHLKVSYIGYETQEVAVKNGQLLKIVLKEESTALNEVVVVGYGTMKRKEMTSAISHIGAKGQYVFGIVPLPLVTDRIIQNLFLSDSGRFLIGKCHDPRPVSFL